MKEKIIDDVLDGRITIKDLLRRKDIPVSVYAGLVEKALILFISATPEEQARIRANPKSPIWSIYITFETGIFTILDQPTKIAVAESAMRDVEAKQRRAAGLEQKVRGPTVGDTKALPTTRSRGRGGRSFVTARPGEMISEGSRAVMTGSRRTRRVKIPTQTTQFEQGERIYLHTIYALMSETSSEMKAVRFLSARGRIRVWKPSEGVGWRDCSPAEEAVYREETQKAIAKRQALAGIGGVYGIISGSSGEFRIAFPSKNESAVTSITGGRICSSIPPTILYNAMWLSKFPFPNGTSIDDFKIRDLPISRVRGIVSDEKMSRRFPVEESTIFGRLPVGAIHQGIISNNNIPIGAVVDGLARAITINPQPIGSASTEGIRFNPTYSINPSLVSTQDSNIYIGGQFSAVILGNNIYSATLGDVLGTISLNSVYRDEYQDGWSQKRVEYTIEWYVTGSFTNPYTKQLTDATRDNICAALKTHMQARDIIIYVPY